MSGRYLLDTNIVIALLAKDSSVQKHLAKADEIFIPATVMGELYFGAFKSGRPKANIARIEDFASSNTVLSCNVSTNREYGQVKNLLLDILPGLKATRIPESDSRTRTAESHY